MPRGDIKDLASACSEVGSVAVLPVDGGWLAGCSGFEFEGMLSFIPSDASKPFVPIYHMGVKMLAKVGNHLYVAGEEPFEFGDAGALDEVRLDRDGKWTIDAVAALPADLEAYQVTQDGIAVADEYNAVFFDPQNGITPLACQE